MLHHTFLRHPVYTAFHQHLGSDVLWNQCLFSVCAAVYLHMHVFVWHHACTINWPKSRWCNITTKVLVTCRIAINVYSLKSAYHNSRRWFVLLQILRGWLIWFPFNENIKMYTTVVHHTWYPRSYVQILFTVNAINMGYT